MEYPGDGKMCPKICCGKPFRVFSGLPWPARQNYIPIIPATLDPGSQPARSTVRPWRSVAHSELKARPMPTEKDVRKALRKVKDPELNLDLVVLGLVYSIEIVD